MSWVPEYIEGHLKNKHTFFDDADLENTVVQYLLHILKFFFVTLWLTFSKQLRKTSLSNFINFLE